MTLQEILTVHRTSIIDEACISIARSRLPNYHKAGESVTRDRIDRLFDLTADSIESRNLARIIDHAETVARERFNAGFDLSEVQTAFNVLEEAIWRRVIEHAPVESFAESFGLIGTVLGAGKDALARTYVSLASKTKAPSLDLHALFTGVAGH